MPAFTKKCFCKKNKIKFHADKNLDEEAVDVLYCPFCVDRASDEAFIVHVTGIPEMIGLWAIWYNKSYLKEADKNFRNEDDYFMDLFASGRCVFGAIWKKRKKPAYEIVGIKSGVLKLKIEELLSGPDYLMIRKDGKPVKLPGKTWTRGEKSPMRQSGYKGHR